MEQTINKIIELEKQICINENAIDEINTQAKSATMPLATNNIALNEQLAILKKETLDYMIANGLSEEPAGYHKAVLSRKPWHVVIPDEKLVPVVFIKNNPTVDKASIKKLLSSGQELSFASKSETEYTLNIKSNV